MIGAYRRARAALDTVLVAALGCPAARWVVLRVQWFIGLFSPVSVLVWCIGLSVGLSGSVILLAIDAGRAPVTISELRETDGMVVQGGRINVLVDADKRRECQATISRFLWRWVEDPARPGERVPLHIPLDGPPVPLTPIGEGQRSILSLAVPSDIAPGPNWHYGSKTIRDCGRFPLFSSVVTSETVPVPIRVLTAEEARGRTPQEGTVRRPDLRP